MQWLAETKFGSKGSEEMNQAFFFSCECHTQWANSGQLDVLFASITFD